MKIVFQIILVVLSGVTNITSVSSQNITLNTFQNPKIFSQVKSIGESSIIDNLDTVVFDLSKAVYPGDLVEFPVWISSDDSVYSLDFALKFNHSNLKYDTILDEVNYLQSLSFYNTSDSTLRYTSNSFQRYSNDTPIVSIYFELLAEYISKSDLKDLNVYLNGTVCSYKIVNPLLTGLPLLNIPKSVLLYPNPSNERLFIELNEKANNLELIDLNNKSIFRKINLSPNQRIEINTNSLETGIYILKIFYDNYLQTKKIEILH